MQVQDIDFQSKDGKKLHAWFVASPQARATLLWFHGNAGNLSHRLSNIQGLLSLNLNIFIFDYRGYGKSEGEPDEEGIYIDSLAAYDRILKIESVSVESLFLFGRSLGGICAVQTALHNPARGLILESVFTSASDMSRKIFPFPSYFFMATEMKSFHLILEKNFLMRLLNLKLFILLKVQDIMIPIL